MNKYFVTGAADVVWGGVGQFGSDNHYFQAAQEELDHPKFVSLGELERELSESDGNGVEIYISREVKLTTAELEKKFPKAMIEVYQPEKTVTSLPILQANPVFKYFLRPLIVFMFVMFAILLGASIFYNVPAEILLGIIALAVSVWAIIVYDRWSMKQIAAFEK